jgi:thymidylate synthase
MSQSCLSFDHQYIKIAREILEDGAEVVGRNNLRYKQMFGQTIKVDLRDGFPALTLRKMPVANLFREFMWDVNGNYEVSNLGPAKHFWDFLADSEGRLAGAYGRSWRAWPQVCPEQNMQWENFRAAPFDQLKWIWEQLQANPTNRQLVLQTFNPAYDSLHCPPCHPNLTFSSDGAYLDLMVNARSNDMATGIPLDMFRYALLTTKMAQDASLIPRYVMFASANNHIYEQNERAIRSIITNGPMASCDVWVNNTKPIFDLDPESDFELIDYVSHPGARMEVAN